MPVLQLGLELLSSHSRTACPMLAYRKEWLMGETSLNKSMIFRLLYQVPSPNMPLGPPDCTFFRSVCHYSVISPKLLSPGTTGRLGIADVQLAMIRGCQRFVGHMYQLRGGMESENPAILGYPWWLMMCFGAPSREIATHGA